MDDSKKEFSSLSEKLLHIQLNLKAPKGQYNKFGEYYYRSCEDIQEALKPLLEEVKAVLLVSDEVVQIGERFYIKATATLRDVESSDSIVNIAFARESESKPKMDAAQITGSCSSYARKYALNGLFCIDDAKDPDYPMGEEARQQEHSQKGKAGKATPPAHKGSGVVYVEQQHINTIRKEISRTGAKEAAVCYQYQIHSLREMTMEQFKDAMAIFKSMPSTEQQQEQYQMTLDGIRQYEDEMPFK